MPLLKITNDQSEYRVEEGDSLQDICDDQGAPIPFGCRAAACGTCRIRVVENPQNLSPMEEDEKDFLENFTNAGKDDRLACQCTVSGDVVVEIVDTGQHDFPGS